MRNELPRITVVTPSYNQGWLLERTIRSVLGQGYPNLEYIIVDGGSTDGSQEIIRRYQDRLAWWVSEGDTGQANAINKALQRATGEWVAWQNSDDIYYPRAFFDLAEASAKNPQVGLIIGDIMLIDEKDRLLRDIRYVKPNYDALRAEGMLLANQAAFWRRDIQNTVGLLNESYHCSFDYDWFLRVTRQARGVHIPRVWGALRLHSETKTSTHTELFSEENQQILTGREVPDWQKCLFKLRRLSLMLSQGQFRYVFRGLLRHLGLNNGETY